ncbi:O-acetyl-ADP-ribose deacetylase [Corynebacterium uropygiale]|uniref:O-acetyl-ADP-ribose deacetylase n=1 Tax=Corynebacterium uropygiale TaxID=1775911 RepID=A0A9X1QR35_9CORY|nr:O-acetyl-ADP-ribose deacetylase [Corynebacterium uropygiale]MCF4006872.1 O-acetyl-ADP-ribose deacetylase [Corynebacterium uropygiale]
MTVTMQSGDITSIPVDAIVNAANPGLLGGGGVDGAIHRAGGPEILAECQELRRTRLPEGLPRGEAVSTTAGRLPARWVIHTAGPVYSRGEDRSAVLRSCYRSCLSEAARLGARRVSFPLISAGVYGWPLEDAAQIAVDSCSAALKGEAQGVEEVILVAYSPDAEEALRRALAASSSR